MTTEVAAMPTKAGSGHSSGAQVWWVLAAAGLLILVGGVAHPEADGSATFEHALAGMLHDGAWPITHTLVLVGMATLAVGLLVVRSTEGRSWSKAARGWTLALSCAAMLGVVELVPHLLGYLQVDTLERTGSAPLLDLHMVIQTVSAPLIGLCFAGLAIVTARRREFGNGPVMAVLAVIGGLAFGAAGILMALLHAPALSPLFMGAAGFSLWLIVGSLRRARGATRTATSR